MIVLSPRQQRHLTALGESAAAFLPDEKRQRMQALLADMAADGGLREEALPALQELLCPPAEADSPAPERKKTAEQAPEAQPPAPGGPGQDPIRMLLQYLDYLQRREEMRARMLAAQIGRGMHR